jgi:hypothetical protein
MPQWLSAGLVAEMAVSQTLFEFKIISLENASSIFFIEMGNFY